MGKYEDFIDGLQADVEVPTDVSKSFDKALNDLTEAPKGKGKAHRWITAIASTAAVLALSTGVLMANPVLAAKIPIIGRIFEQVEDKVTYSGDFKDKADVLVVDPEVTSEAEDVNSTYVAEGNGIKVTASEVYCDGYSIYLTTEIKAENGGLSKVMSYYSDRNNFDGVTVHFMYTEGTWNTAGASGALINNHIEGNVIDDNTLVGMIKIDFGKVVSGDGVFDLDLSFLGYDSEESMNNMGDDISAGHKYEGEWQLSIPYTVDTKSAKMITVNEQSADGFGIEKIFVSPYQVVVYSIVPTVPSTVPTVEDFMQEDYAEGFGQDDFEEMLGEQNDELLAAGEGAITYDYTDFDLGLYNQDGEELEWQGAGVEDDGWVSYFAIKNLDVTTINAFVGAEFLDIIKAKDMNEAKAKAIWSTTIDVK